MISLRNHLPAPRYTLTTALPAGEWALKNIDLPGLLTTKLRGLFTKSRQRNAVVDLINIMTYDFAGPWTNGESGHQASLHPPARPHNAFAKRSISGVTRYLVSDRKIDPACIVIGVPVYGRSFLGVRGPGERFTGIGGDGDGTFEYRSLPRLGSVESVDTAIGAASCHAGAEGWITYDNPETVEMKARFVKAHGLGGMFFWTGSFDADNEKRSLVHAGYRALHST